ADTVRVGERLFDVVSIPVFGTGDNLIGALTFGSEIGNATAQELRDFTRCQVVLLANGHVIASTISNPAPRQELAQLCSACSVGPGRGGPRQVLLGDEHYFCSAGRFDTLSGDERLGYLLLSSYEQPLRALQSTQLMLLAVSALGILLGTAIV